MDIQRLSLLLETRAVLASEGCSSATLEYLLRVELLNARGALLRVLTLRVLGSQEATVAVLSALGGRP